MNVRINKQSLDLAKTTIYYLYKLHDNSTRVNFIRGKLEQLKESGSWAGRRLEDLEREQFLARGRTEIDTLERNARKLSREVLFLLTDRPNRGVNMNELVERGDRDTLKLLVELSSFDIDGWDKKDLEKAASQLEYRLKRRRVVEADSAGWTGR